MPAFLGLLTALGPAVTGAALALAHPASAPAYTAPATTAGSWEICSYVFTFGANGALLTGTCEGRITTWGWRPFRRTTGAGEPGKALRDVPEARGGGPEGAAGRSGYEAEADGREADGKGVDGREADGKGVDEREADGRGADEGEVDGGEAGGGAYGVPGVTPDARPDGRASARNTSDGARGRLPGQIAVTAALGQLGTPFSWGGGSAAGPTKGVGRGSRTRGFDCSGLTLYAWAKAGVRLGHYTGRQFRQGRRIVSGELRAGDLVFFGGGRGDPTHVGLYLRDGVMIHAPKTGDVVKKTNFAKSPYFAARYRGAVRPSG
ncbi:NlpC/P60 family protein [Thermopolyspora sp. NPDC052614]|uniref:NlpC/P60 family protein n=1 Tax=Thermopolyspora sp. NPDC052614 TaxID=3155682 RepID=UPI00342610F0